MDLGLIGKKVLITASSSGIGRATAEMFLQEGSNVVVNGRNKEKLLKVYTELCTDYPQREILYFCGDMSNEDIVDECYSFINNIWGYLDILVPAAGTGKPISNNTTDIKEWQYMIEKNLLGTIKIINCFYDLLKKGNSSSIVLISSIVAYERMNTHSAYAASKSSLLILNKYLSAELAESRIRINCVVPGNIFFNGGRWYELEKEDPEGVRDYINNNVPMRRFGTPQEIAAAIVFLSSIRAEFITGAELVIDGGQKRS